MAPQADIIADTIVGLKRALQKDRDSLAVDTTVTKPTNRGNKLQTGAKYMHEGALTYIRGIDSYKEKVEHAGYTKFILSRNPKRYDEFDEELDEFSSDEEADAAAAEENAYGGIKLEELLCPLKHPSELPTHPSLSAAYLSDTLPKMIESIGDKLRQEQANLWRAKALYRQVLGDTSWIPCEAVETTEDSNIFEPGEGVYQHAAKKRKTDTSVQRKEGTENNKDMAQNATAASDIDHENAPPLSEGGEKRALADVDMVDAEADHGSPKETDGSHEQNQASSVTVAEPPRVAEDFKKDPGSNAVDGPDTSGNSRSQTDAIPSPDAAPDGEDASPRPGSARQRQSDSSEHSSSASSSATPPPPPRRMTTRARALAAESNSISQSSNPTPPLSPTSTNTSLTVHPLFLIPESVKPDRDFGLYPQEADETRRLLGMYSQKQEECVRGYERMLCMLMKAQRMRQDVLEWCKAEGHVGEMSDGEDWYDREFWGLDEEGLRKGHDEDDEAGAQGLEEVRGKKTRRRA